LPSWMTCLKIQATAAAINPIIALCTFMSIHSQTTHDQNQDCYA
jgi:hypothetical protein